MTTQKILVNTLRDDLFSLGKLRSDGDPENAKKLCQVLLHAHDPDVTVEKFETMYGDFFSYLGKYYIPRIPENVNAAKIAGELFGIISREFDVNNGSEDEEDPEDVEDEEDPTKRLAQLLRELSKISST